MLRPPKSLILVYALMIAHLASPGEAQPFSDLGHALYAKGYTRTVWVNSFDRRLAYLAHGVFYPETPIGRQGYDARYGMTLAGSGTVSVDGSGHLMATGTATNPNSTPAEGDITIALLRNGALVDTAEVPFSCGSSSRCPWEVHFGVKPADFPHPSMRSFTVNVSRHVEGSRCGGELSVDLSAEPCHSNVINRFNLPPGYRFTNTDSLDTNYLALPGGSTTALCTEILPLCGGQTGSQPPPPADPCADWLAATQQWLAQLPQLDASCGELTAALAAWAAAFPTPPGGCLNP
jgi:hypothetical protein